MSPVLVGTGAAAALGAPIWWKAFLALLVALALQVGVNYANDYSDGIRGTDTHRVGPLRLVGSGVAAPGKVRLAAFISFGVAASCGLVLALTSAWWLVLVGVAAIAAAWFYTGGAKPYGYRGFGEISVFVFFGIVAVLGTTCVQAGRVGLAAVAGAVAIGALTCNILVANNVRDIPTDAEVGKRTLAVILGDRASRRLYAALVAVAFAMTILIAVAATPWALLAFGSAPLFVRPARRMLSGATGRDLIPVLRDTGLAELLYAALLMIGLVVS